MYSNSLLCAEGGLPLSHSQRRVSSWVKTPQSRHMQHPRLCNELMEAIVALHQVVHRTKRYGLWRMHALTRCTLPTMLHFCTRSNINRDFLLLEASFCAPTIATLMSFWIAPSTAALIQRSAHCVRNSRAIQQCVHFCNISYSLSCSGPSGAIRMLHSLKKRKPIVCKNYSSRSPPTY